MNDLAEVSTEQRDGHTVVALSGALTLARLGDLPQRLAAQAGAQTIDLSGVTRIDTVGAWIITKFARDSGAVLTGAKPNVETMIENVEGAAQPVSMRPDAKSPLVRVLGEIGDATIQSGRTLLGLLGFFGAVCISVVAVMAHPGLVPLSASALAARVGFLAEDAGLDGLEALYSQHSPADTARFLALAAQHGLLVTGGSDFHGTPKPTVPLGIVFEGQPAPYRLLEDLRSRAAAA